MPYIVFIFKHNQCSHHFNLSYILEYTENKVGQKTFTSCRHGGRFRQFEHLKLN